MANLPYIGEDEEIGEDVRLEDPKIALYGGGKDGFALVAELLDQTLLFAKDHKEVYLALEF